MARSRAGVLQTSRPSPAPGRCRRWHRSDWRCVTPFSWRQESASVICPPTYQAARKIASDAGSAVRQVRLAIQSHQPMTMMCTLRMRLTFQLFGSQGWKQNTAPNRSQTWQRPSAALLRILLRGTITRPFGPGLMRARHRPSSPMYAVVGRQSPLGSSDDCALQHEPPPSGRMAVASRTGLRHCHIDHGARRER